MRDIIKDRRREAGAVTLLFASVFAFGWMRSLNHEDMATLDFGESKSGPTHSRWDYSEDREEQMAESKSVTVKSIGQSIIVFRNTGWGIGGADRKRLSWYSKTVPFGTTEEFTSEGEWPDEGRWQFCGLDFGFTKGRITVNYGWTSDVYKIPYAYFVVPLAIVSFSLLLSKPPKADQSTLAEPPRKNLQTDHNPLSFTSTQSRPQFTTRSLNSIGCTRSRKSH